MNKLANKKQRFMVTYKNSGVLIYKIVKVVVEVEEKLAEEEFNATNIINAKAEAYNKIRTLIGGMR